MSTNMMQHVHDWDAQRERLSAYLDNELPTAERMALERHVAGCVRCAAELAELRQVVALLSTLPPPRLPRSFVLPAAAPTRSARAAAVAARPARQASAPRWAVAAQWAGGLAAAAGLFILLGSALAGGAPMLARAPASSGGSAAMQRTHTVDGQTYGPSATMPANPTTSPNANPSGSPVGAPGGTFVRTPQSPTATADDTHAGSAPQPAPLELPIAGATLLVGGSVAFAFGRRASRRSRA
jgi:hypothetical protein